MPDEDLGKDFLSRRAEEARHFLAAIVESSEDSIATIDFDGVITTWNKSAERVYGYLAAEAIGKPITMLMLHEDLKELFSKIDEIKHSRKVKIYDTVRVRKDDRQIVLEIVLSPVKDDAGQVIGVSTVARDVTAQREAEGMRKLLLESEQIMRAEAEQANRLKEEFLATVTHELRTPLNAILGWSKMLRVSNFDQKSAAEAIEIIERNARAQNLLIEDLLDVSRITAGKLRLDVRAVDLPKVITAAVDAVRPAATAKNISLQKLLGCDAELISGDPDRLQQVVWNLLSNAVKFTPHNGRVQVQLERAGSHVEIVVSDTGKGIEPEFLPFVFDRFRQADQSSSRAHSGLGLGLAIVRQLVELHGGTITVKSEGAERGSSFTVSLPFIPLRTEMQSEVPRVHQTAEKASATNSPRELSGLRVLLVDAKADSRDLLNLMLNSSGAEVTAVSSAAQAFDVIKCEKFDAIVTSIGMPEEDGFALIGKIRNLPDDAGGAVPAIALTAYARAEDRVRALRAGFQMHIAKPVESAELVVAVANLAGRMRNLNENS